MYHVSGMQNRAKLTNTGFLHYKTLTGDGACGCRGQGLYFRRPDEHGHRGCEAASWYFRYVHGNCFLLRLNKSQKTSCLNVVMSRCSFLDSIEMFIAWFLKDVDHLQKHKNNSLDGYHSFRGARLLSFRDKINLLKTQAAGGNRRRVFRENKLSIINPLTNR